MAGMKLIGWMSDHQSQRSQPTRQVSPTPPLGLGGRPLLLDTRTGVPLNAQNQVKVLDINEGIGIMGLW